jgi:hypothetical protein
MLPYDHTHPFERIPERICQSVRAEWGIACSDKGWMRATVSFKYFANIFILPLLQRV